MGLIIRLQGTLTDTSLPKLYKDAIINTGTLYCFDFLDTNCNANAFGGTLAIGATFTNLVPNGASAVVTDGANIVNTISGLKFTSSAGSVDLGTGYDLSVSGHDFLSILWYKQVTGEYTSTAFQGILGRSNTNTNAAQFMYDTGADGKTARASIGNSAEVKTLTVGATTLDVYNQIAIAKVGSSRYAYKNGALVASGTIADGTLLGATAHEVINTGTYMASMPRYVGYVGRTVKEDLTVSAAVAGITTTQQALAQVVADYANLSRFS